MPLFGRDIEKEPVIIAEVGVNHEGSFDAALKILTAAADAGADAVKFQCYTPMKLVSADDQERLERVRRFAFSEQQFLQLSEAAKSAGVSFLSTAVTEDWVQFIANSCEAIKIASADIDFEPVVRSSASTGRTIILSTGASTIDEIDRAVGWVTEEIGKDQLREHLILLHCVTAYPAPAEEANLLAIGFLAKRYGLNVGYSNHVPGIHIPLAAVALGANVIEVHVTDQREGRTFRDHSLSLEPNELRELVQQARVISKARGQPEKQLQPCERGMLPAIRKGIVAARAIPAGTVLSCEDVMYARPRVDFGPADVKQLLGRKSTRALRKGEPILKANIET